VQTALSLPEAIQDNPFRILNLPPDASLRDIQQQGDHLLVLSEMDAAPTDDLLPWLPPPDRSPEAIRRAIHELHDGVRRIFAEAMWLPPPRDAGAVRAYEALKARRPDEVQGASLPPQATAILSLARLVASPQSADAWAAVTEDCATWWLSPTWDDLTRRLRNSHDPRLRSLDAEQVRNATVVAVAEFWRQAILSIVNQEQHIMAVGILRATQPIHHLWPEAAADLRRELIDALSKALNDILDPVRSAPGDTDLTPVLSQATAKLRSIRARIEAIVAAFEPRNLDWLALNDTLAETYRQLAVAWNNKSGDCDKAHALLKEAEAIPASEQVRAKLTRDLETVADIVAQAQRARTLFAGFTPIDKAPTLLRINGIGQAMIGEQSIGDGRAISTLFFTILWIPIFALKRYVIQREGNSYRFYLKGPLTSRQRWWNGIVATALMALFFLDLADTGTTVSVPQPAAPVPIASSSPASIAPPQPSVERFEDQIVVGRSIGGIELGWTIDNAVAFVGRGYDGSRETKDGGRAYYWRLDGEKFANPDPQLPALLVAFTNASGRIQEIQTTAGWFKTKSGIEVGHPRRVLLERIRPDSTWNWRSGYQAEARSSSGLGWAYKTLNGVETIVMFVVFPPER
jgi:hypothetical protein